MSTGIILRNGLIVSFADDFIFKNQDGANGNFLVFRGCIREQDRLLHKVMIGFSEHTIPIINVIARSAFCDEAIFWRLLRRLRRLAMTNYSHSIVAGGFPEIS